MSFLGDLLQAVAQTQQRGTVGVGTLGGGKRPECTPCAAGAYVDGLKASIRGTDKPKRKKRK